MIVLTLSNRPLFPTFPRTLSQLTIYSYIAHFAKLFASYLATAYPGVDCSLLPTTVGNAFLTRLEFICKKTRNPECLLYVSTLECREASSSCHTI